uniref:Uncharacterized protein n=1 Tax=Entomoneis paludosa TaxID=265537 RepID=A0A6U3CRG7_9STRA|mmetsp:Transcript_36063/g.74993  ORF Transcript_36063/g.74993 Transcript_36063/m.74993 type:complete len:193 (+) Transcript_36063:714-1292(+)
MGISLKDIAAEYFVLKGIGANDFNVSQLQLLLASAKSSHQVWHRDNVNPGLTVLIALRDVVSNGPTEILLRSHGVDEKDFLKNILWPKSPICSENNVDERALLASIEKGDAIIYDCRCLHRGRGYGNSSGYVNGDEYDDGEFSKFGQRPVLVIRFDATQTPAPGTGVVGYTLAKWEGSTLSLICAMLSWLGL